MDRYEYQELKESGGLVTDAALQEEPKEPVIIEEVEEEPTEPTETVTEEPEDDLEPLETDDEDDLPPLNEKEKTAFEKRMERERTKLQEKLEAELKQQYEQQYGKHKQVIDLLGGDPDAIERRIKEQQLAAEAQKLADANGWDEEQTRWYVEQQKKDQRMQELEVQVQINELKDNPDYAGIGTMKQQIIGMIQKSGNSITVEQAFWALGGKNRAEQIRLETQMREQVKRQKQPRTVLTDAPTSTTGEKPLPPEITKEAERMGISMAEARRLMNSEPAQDIEAWRKQRKAAK